MTMHVLVIGDVGDEMYHVGDEAMFETALLELAARGDVEVTAITSGPDRLADRYGVRGVAQLGFDDRRGAAYDEHRETRLREVLDRTVDDSVIGAWWEAVEGADAVLVAGGGNLCSSWPHLVYERIAVLRAATDRGLPVVLVGQSVGPHLTPRQRDQLAPLLGSANLVGVRDEASVAFVEQLSPDASVLLHVDDAVGLPDGEVWTDAPSSYVVLAVHQVAQRAEGALQDALVAFARSMRDASGVEVVLLPNTGALSGTHEPGSDAHWYDEWRDALATTDGIRVAPVLTTRHFATTVRRADAVVSSRFHPVVFALGGVVPAMALSSDSYTAGKLDGALVHAGLGGWRLPFATVGGATPSALFTEMMARRDEVAGHLRTVTGTWLDRHSTRWDLVHRSLQGDRPSATDLRSPVPPSPLRPTMDTALLRLLENGQYGREDELVRAVEVAEEYADSLLAALERTTRDAAAAHTALEQAALAADDAERRFRRELAIREDHLAEAIDEMAREQRSADAAREAAGRAYRELADFEPGVYIDPHYVASLERELQAMRATRVFRWTRPFRSIYGRIRTSGSRRRS